MLIFENCEAKVTEFNIILWIKEYVSRFQISMNEAFAVDIADGFRHLTEHFPLCLFLLFERMLFEKLFKRASLAIFNLDVEHIYSITSQFFDEGWRMIVLLLFLTNAFIVQCLFISGLMVANPWDNIIVFLSIAAATARRVYLGVFGVLIFLLLAFRGRWLGVWRGVRFRRSRLWVIWGILRRWWNRTRFEDCRLASDYRCFLNGLLHYFLVLPWCNRRRLLLKRMLVL